MDHRPRTRADLIRAGLPPDSVTSATPERPCPACGAILDRATSVAAEDPVLGPEPGDAALCVACGSVLVFTADLHYRVATQAEVDALQAQFGTELEQAQAVIARAQPRSARRRSC
jgi:hypothetical protein